MPSSSSTTSTVVGGLCGSGLGMALTYVPSTTRASRAIFALPWRLPLPPASPPSEASPWGTGPTSVIFDFDLAPGGKADRWPTADDAYRACAAASGGGEVAEGSVGAGTGATVGKALGPRAAMKGGVGTWAASGGDIVVGALVVLNAVGNILDASGAILAGARGADGSFVDALAHFGRGGAPFGAGARNTSLAVVATNAALDRTALEGLAQAAGDALARRIVPYGTLFDGDA